MGRCKIEIKRIENATNRHVTFSKRRGGLIKKAKELSVLCSAEVAVIIFSSTGKLFAHPESSSKIKKILQRYQDVAGKILDEYQNVPLEIRRLQTELQRLNVAVRQMMGEDLNWLSSNDLRVLEEHLHTAILSVRRKRDEVEHQEREEERNSAKREMAEERESARKREELLQGRIVHLEQMLDNRCAPRLSNFLNDKALESNPFNLIPPTSSIRVQQTQTNLSETDFLESQPELRLGFGGSHQNC